MSRVLFEIDEYHTFQLKRIKNLAKMALIISLIAMTLVIILLISQVFLISAKYDASEKSEKLSSAKQEKSSLPEEKNATSINIISRSMWNASQPSKDLGKLIRPVEKIILSHSAAQECATKNECAQVVLSIQKSHLTAANLDDIGYNFLIGGDGNVYEGRGWNFQGAHTSGFNPVSLGIVYIGTFSDKLPNQKQLDAGFALFKEGVRLGVLSSNYTIKGACQLRQTQSPGKKFYELITTWDHWSSY